MNLLRRLRGVLGPRNPAEANADAFADYVVKTWSARPHADAKGLLGDDAEPVYPGGAFREGGAWYVVDPKTSMFGEGDTPTKAQADLDATLAELAVIEERRKMTAWSVPRRDMCPNCVTPWKCNGPHLSAPTRTALPVTSRICYGGDPHRYTTREGTVFCERCGGGPVQ